MILDKILMEVLRIRSVLDLLNLARQIASEVIVGHVRALVEHSRFCYSIIRLRGVEL